MNKTCFRKMSNLLLVSIILSIPLLNFSCKEDQVVEYSTENQYGERFSESDFHEIIKHFFNSVFYTEPVKIEIDDKYIKTEVNEMTFFVTCGNDLRRCIIKIDVLTGEILFCQTGWNGKDYHDLIQKQQPEKYIEYLAYRERMQEKNEEEKKQRAKHEAEYRERLKDPEYLAKVRAAREKWENPDNLTEEEKEFKKKWQLGESNKYDKVIQEKAKWEEFLAWKPEYAKVSEEEVFERIKPLFNYYNLPLNIERCFYRYNPNVSTLHIISELEYEGVVYQHAYLAINLSLYSGQINDFKYTPIGSILIEQVVSPISKIDAIKAATVVMRDNEIYFKRSGPPETIDYEYGDKMDDIIPVIVYPAKYSFIPKDKKAYIANLSQELRYCWRVPFYRYMENETKETDKKPYLRPFYIFVDQETGKVIRGWVGPDW